MKTKIEPNCLTDNYIKLIGQDWMLVSAASGDKFNAMTASWGGVGFLWNKPVAFIFIRPERYTFEFIESANHFSLSFFMDEYKPVLSVMGSKSGRDIDKMGNSGLTPYFTSNGTPAFKEARITLECRTLYSTMLTKENFIDVAPMQKWYGNGHGSLHKMYVAEIENVWIEQ